jgi:hypothetical protein
MRAAAAGGLYSSVIWVQAALLPQRSGDTTTPFLSACRSISPRAFKIHEPFIGTPRVQTAEPHLGIVRAAFWINFTQPFDTLLRR